MIRVEGSIICYIQCVGRFTVLAGKFGGEFDLAVWRFSEDTAKLNSANVNSIFGRCGLLR